MTIVVFTGVRLFIDPKIILTDLIGPNQIAIVSD
jgi:hypothetical protein